MMPRSYTARFEFAIPGQYTSWLAGKGRIGSWKGVFQSPCLCVQVSTRRNRDAKVKVQSGDVLVLHRVKPQA